MDQSTSPTPANDHPRRVSRWIYLLLIEPLLSGAKRALLREVLRRTPAGARLLEVACGTCTQARMIARAGAGRGAGDTAGSSARAAGPRFDVTAVDISARLFPPHVSLSGGTEGAAGPGTGNVQGDAVSPAAERRQTHGRPAAGEPRILVADGRALPFATATFDAALISLALHEMDPRDRPLVVAELIRVVRPGGRLFIMDYDLRIERSPRAAAAILIRIIERIAGKRHHRNFRNFLENGGVPALLPPHEALLHARRPVLGGMGSIFIVDRKRSAHGAKHGANPADGSSRPEKQNAPDAREAGKNAGGTP